MPRQDLRRDSAAELNAEFQAAVHHGTRAVLAAQIGSQLISLGVLAAMLRLVDEEDYGLLAIALPALMLPRMAATLGTGVATVQGATLSAGQLNWLFWLTALAGIFASAITAASGPLLAWSYAQPELTTLCALLAGSTIVAALGTQHQALLERGMRLTSLARLRLVAQAIGGITGIALAWRGMGVWALVAQQYGELIVLSGGVWVLESWRPGLPPRGEKIRPLFALSSYYSLSMLVIYLAQNLDKILLPLLFGDVARGALGLYSQAFNLMMRPVNLVTTPLFSVMLPALSRTLHDRVRYAELVARFFRLTAIALFPCGIGLWSVAPEAMLVLGGERWRDAGLLLSALAPAIIVQGLLNLSAAVFASTGRTGRLLTGSLVMLLLLAQGLLAGYFLGRLVFPSGSPEGAALASALGMAAGYSSVLVLVLTLPYLFFCFRSLGISLASVLRPLWPAFRAAVVMGLVVAALRQVLIQQPSVPLAIRLLILLIVGAATYAFLARRELRWFSRELTVLGARGTPQ